MWMKPRMRQAKSGWICYGAGWFAVGDTQREAYEAWTVMAGIPDWLTSEVP